MRVWQGEANKRVAGETFIKPELRTNSIKLRLARAKRNSYDQVPISTEVLIEEIPQAFLSGFRNHESLTLLSSRLRELCFAKLSDSEQENWFREQQKLKQFRKEARKLVLEGAPISLIKRPKTPVSNKLENLVYQMELEITAKVLKQMSTLNKRFLKQEFELLEENSHKSMALPSAKPQQAINISNFYAKLESVAQGAIEERNAKKAVLRVV